MFLQLQRAYVDDLKIHDLADPAIPYALRSMKRSFAVRRVEQPRPSRQGVVDRTAEAGDRVRPLFGPALYDLSGYTGAPGATEEEALAATQDAHDALVGVLTGPGVRTLRWLRRGRTEEEQALCTIAGGPDDPSEGFALTVRWAVTLESADPRVFSAVLSSAQYDPTASLSGGGAPMPLVFPLVFSTTTATELFVTNGGNAPTPPTLTIRGPVANPAIDNDSTGESILIRYTLGSADVVQIDVSTRRTYLNGSLRRDLVETAGTTWWELQPGENAVRLRGSGMVPGQTSLTASWRDARR